MCLNNKASRSYVDFYSHAEKVAIGYKTLS